MTNKDDKYKPLIDGYITFYKDGGFMLNEELEKILKIHLRLFLLWKDNNFH